MDFLVTQTETAKANDKCVGHWHLEGAASGWKVYHMDWHRGLNDQDMMTNRENRSIYSCYEEQFLKWKLSVRRQTGSNSQITVDSLIEDVAYCNLLQTRLQILGQQLAVPPQTHISAVQFVGCLSLMDSLCALYSER